jgi:hypothetical protein
LRFLLH